MSPKIFRAIGLMSGTSLDGIDAALIRTDGYNYVETGEFITVPYKKKLQASIRACLGKRQDKDSEIAHVENELTAAHADIVAKLLKKAKLKTQDIDVIGFHGHTIFHDPVDGFTWQIGDGAILACLTQIDVVNDFRSADVKAGGQGAPLLPLYHKALSDQARLKKPVAILNIGGVANITYLGKEGEILSFDTGPGNALMNDWVRMHTKRDYDEDGKFASQGKIDESMLDHWAAHPYFSQTPPKSLDRDAWDLPLLKEKNLFDGAATLSAFTVRAVKQALPYLPQKPASWYVTGGGRHNSFLMKNLQNMLQVPVQSVEDLGWNGDALEAQGFAYLAVRSLLGQVLSLPTTTGVPQPLTGGILNTA